MKPPVNKKMPSAKKAAAMSSSEHPHSRPIRRWGLAGILAVAVLAAIQLTGPAIDSPPWQPASAASSDRLTDDRPSLSASEPGFENPAAFGRFDRDQAIGALDWYRGWQRPPGPPKVALQAGHWKKEEAPDEMEGLRDNGTRGGGHEEWQVNLEIAQATQKLLADFGVQAEILPTTVPPDYYADVFVAIHADGNPNWRTNGYKVASSWWDLTGQADDLAADLEDTYGQATGLAVDPVITQNMRGYYAFNWRRYAHSLHPMTVGAIVETGFLTSYHDRLVIVRHPEVAAAGIARGILINLRDRGLLTGD